MTQRPRAIAVLILWLLATGAQWDLLQVFAWGRMFAGYAESMDLSEAAEQTFNGDMCELCRAVEQAKEQQRELPVPDSGKIKIVLLCPDSSRLVLPLPDLGSWPPAEARTGVSFKAPPPTPPPRAA